MSTRSVMTGIAIAVLLLGLVGVALSLSAGVVPWWGLGGLFGAGALLVLAQRLPKE